MSIGPLTPCIEVTDGHETWTLNIAELAAANGVTPKQFEDSLEAAVSTGWLGFIGTRGDLRRFCLTVPQHVADELARTRKL